MKTSDFPEPSQPVRDNPSSEEVFNWRMISATALSTFNLKRIPPSASQTPPFNKGGFLSKTGRIISAPAAAFFYSFVFSGSNFLWSQRKRTQKGKAKIEDKTICGAISV